MVQNNTVYSLSRNPAATVLPAEVEVVGIVVLRPGGLDTVAGQPGGERQQLVGADQARTAWQSGNHYPWLSLVTRQSLSPDQ